MSRPHFGSEYDARAARFESLLADSDIVQEYRNQVARLASTDGLEADHLDATDIAKYADLTACQSLNVCVAGAVNGDVYFAHDFGEDAHEMVFCDVLFVKSTFLPPLPARDYRSPGTLLYSLSLVAPPGEERGTLAIAALQNMYLRMSTASASRTFTEYITRPWMSNVTHGDQHAIVLTAPVFTQLSNSQPEGTTSACAIPPAFDRDGFLQRTIECSKGALCFTAENVVRVCDLTVSSKASKAVRFPTPDVIVPGQLVYVTFSAKGWVPRAGNGRRERRGPGLKYAFRPTIRSIFILSKSGPMAMARGSMLKIIRGPEKQDMVDALKEPQEQDISRDLKRLRISNV